MAILKLHRAVLSTLMLSLVLVGCSAEKRAMRHMKKAERLCSECFTEDTMLIYVPAEEINTEVHLQKGEIRTIQQGRLTLTIQTKYKHDSLPPIIVEARCDTFVKEVTVPVFQNKYIEREPTFWDRVEDILMIILIIVIAIGAIHLIRSFKS